MYERYYSTALHGDVSIGMIVPEEIRSITIFLHGFHGSFKSMTKELPMDAYAKDFKTLIVTPDLGDLYYLDQKKGDNEVSISHFVAFELPALIRSRFSIPSKTPLYLTGLSMGGYGSVLIGARYPQCFDGIVSFSGAFIDHDVAIVNEEICGSTLEQKLAFTKPFGDLSTLESDPERSPVAALMAVQDVDSFPPLLLLCGDKDPMMGTYRSDKPYQTPTRLHRVINALEAKNIPYHYINIDDGEHKFDCFRKEIPSAFLHFYICNML